MFSFFKLVALCVSFLLLPNTALCKAKKAAPKTIEQRYEIAVRHLTKGYYKSASDEFFGIYLETNAGEMNHKAILLESYCLYKLNHYEDAITTINDFLEFYPSGPNLDYAYYLKMLCFWDQVRSVATCSSEAVKALSECKRVIDFFPGTEYAADASKRAKSLKLFLLNSKLEQGRTQIRRKNPVGAITALKSALEMSSEVEDCNQLVLEIHFRMTESYLMLGIREASLEHIEFLRQNFSSSPWTKALEQMLVKSYSELFSTSIK